MCVHVAGTEYKQIIIRKRLETKIDLFVIYVKKTKLHAQIN